MTPLDLVQRHAANERARSGDGRVSLRDRAWALVAEDVPGGERYDVFMQLLIMLNVLALVAETEATFRARWGGAFDAFEHVSVAAFTADYLMRLWSCTAAPRYAGSIRGRLRYFLSPAALVDLFAILPYYLPLLGVDLRAFRALRLARLLRLAKLGRYSRALGMLRAVLVAKRAELTMTLGVATALLFAASALMYGIEREAQPQTFGSVPRAMWWGVATLTTIGYGDVVPVTALGRVLASCLAVLGIGVVALPTAILGAGFVEEMQARASACPPCPHCGQPMRGRAAASDETPRA